MKFVVQAVLGLSLVFVTPAFAATTVPAAQAAVANTAHVKAVQDLLSVMQLEKELWGVASRSRYQNPAQRQAVFAKLEKTPPSEVYQRLAPPLARVISAETATEMTRFYNTPYGKKVIHKKYNSGVQMNMEGMTKGIPAEEKKERKRAAYVKASKELADAEPVLQSETFKLLQLINKEKR